MKIQESAENYLETIFILSQRKEFVRSIDIANELSFSKPSISVFMKNLKTNGYIEMDGRGHITLTQAGLSIAKKVYEKHTFIKEILLSLGVNEEIASEDACRIEHVISDETFDALKKHFSK